MLAYRVVNLHPGLGDAPPPTSSDCSQYQRLMDDAAANIALAQREIKYNAQNNNKFFVDHWNAVAASANRDWQVAKDDLTRCQAQAKTSPDLSVQVPILPLVLGIGILAVGAFLGGSTSLRFY